MSPTVRMQDIADELGVSRTTVSLVLTGKGEKYRIADKTVRRILKKVRELDFKPNYFAQTLNSRKTGVIGLVLPNVAGEFMTGMIEGMEEVLYPGNYTLVVSTSRFDNTLEKKHIEQLIHRGTDGLILAFNVPFDGEEYSLDHIESLLESSLPVVLVDRYLDHIAATKVIQDDRQGAIDAVRRLVEQGAHEIGFISFKLDISSIRKRYEGYIAGLQECGLEHNPQNEIWLTQRNQNAHDLKDALYTLMQSDKAPDGFVVSTAGLAYKTKYLLEKSGGQRCQNVRIAKFGQDAPWQDSGMISVNQPHREMGKRAARLLLDTIEGRIRRKKTEILPLQVH